MEREVTMTKKVLIADDNTHARRLVELTLGNQNYTFLETDDGADALDLARREHPDLVILDVMLPSLDGLAVCRELKADPALAATPVLMLSCIPDRGIASRGQAAGALRYLTKPFSPTNLLSEVEQLVHA
jgi:DNA-binding response OmpR family regulator